MPKLKESEDTKKDKQLQNIIVSQFYQQGITRKEVARKLRMTTNTLRNKISNPDDLSIGEARALADFGK